MSRDHFLKAIYCHSIAAAVNGLGVRPHIFARRVSTLVPQRGEGGVWGETASVSLLWAFGLGHILFNVNRVSTGLN